MAIRDRIAGFLEERLDVTVLDRADAQRLRESADHFEEFKSEAEELAYWTLYRNGRASEMRPERRARLAQRCRVALMQDPLAGAEADMLSNFAFGKGIAVPEAEDEDVQAVIRENWTDSVNEQKLTGFGAQRLRSNQLVTNANLIPAAFRGKGKVKLAFIDPDRVVDIVTDPDDEERPLYYVVEDVPPVEWDYTIHQPKIQTTPIDRSADGTPLKVLYWPHWRNVEDVDIERRDAGLPELEKPPENLIAKGVVEHFAWNRIGNSLWGTPPWARTLRFYSAMNMLLESHVAMAEAASSFIARRGITGNADQITRSANSILNQTGEIAAGRFGDADGAGFGDADLGGRRHGGPAPGSFIEENESSKLESLSLSSGAGQMLQTAQIVRAPIAAASGFGQHYLGDTSGANLATATSLELPTTMTVQAWQQFHASIMEWFVDLCLETAIRAGRLNDAVKRKEEEERGEDPEDWDQDGDGVPDREQDATADLRPMSELRLRESDDRREIEERTGHTFDYKVSMPYPGRRNLPDVTAMVTTVKEKFDPTGANVPMQRGLLRFLAKEGLLADDPDALVDEWLPAEAGDAVARQALSQVQGQVDSQDQAAQAQAAQAAGGLGPDGLPLIPGAPLPTGAGPSVPGGDPAQKNPSANDKPLGAKGLFEGVFSDAVANVDDPALKKLLKEAWLDPILDDLSKPDTGPES